MPSAFEVDDKLKLGGYSTGRSLGSRPFGYVVSGVLMACGAPQPACLIYAIYCKIFNSVNYLTIPQYL
jgi:hypothetical protein